MGSDTMACSSSNSGSAMPHARVPVACGHGDGASPQRTQFVTVGAGVAASTVGSFEAIAAGWPTVKTAAVRIDVTGTLAPAAQSRSGWYLGHCCASTGSKGMLAPTSAVKSGALWIVLPDASSAEFMIMTA